MISNKLFDILGLAYITGVRRIVKWNTSIVMSEVNLIDARAVFY